MSFAPGCKRFQLLLGLMSISVFAPAGAAVHAASGKSAAFTPIHAELVGPMDARFLKPGSPLLLKVKDAWQNDDCSLREGSILKGHVVAANVSSKEDRISKVALLVDEAECNGQTLVPMPLAVAAMMAPDPMETGNMQEYAPLNEGPVATGGGAGSGTSSMRSVSAAAIIAQNSAMPVDAPKRMALGDVIGLSGLKLSVGTGPEYSSVLSDKGRNVSLHRDTQFVLVPEALIRRAEPAAEAVPIHRDGAATATAQPVRADLPKLPPKPSEPDVEVCEPPSCSMALPAADTAGEGHAAKSFSLRELGYAPRYGVELDDFNHDAALVYLGRDRLLVTFNPHTLIRRAEDDWDSARVVRATLLDTTTLKVIRTVDWQVNDRKQYLWPVGEDRVLAHVGNELRVYGPDLKVERRIELDGPLAWVRVAPAKKNFAIGVIEERHSKELHAQLVAESNREPEEDVEIRIMDADFRTMVTAIRSSRFMPPVLTDTGEVGMYLQGNDRYHLVEHTWDHQTRSIAHFESSCMPQVSSIAPGLLFVVSCARNGDAKYKALRRDGRPLLQGASSSDEVGLGAQGSSLGESSPCSGRCLSSLRPAGGALRCLPVGEWQARLCGPGGFTGSDAGGLRAGSRRGGAGRAFRRPDFPLSHSCRLIRVLRTILLNFFCERFAPIR
jgi:hypothetical protein